MAPPTRVVVPLDVERPKTRLSPALDAAERRAFALAMADDVVAALGRVDATPRVLATGSLDGRVVDAPVDVDDRPLTAAVNAALADAADAGAPLAVVMADLPLVTPAAARRLLDADGDVVLVPGRGGGTNALVARHPGFRVDYHGVSVRDHRATAARLDATVGRVDSYRLSTDVDEPADLVEVLLHGDGAAADWLADAGFEVVVDETEGRVRATREA